MPEIDPRNRRTHYGSQPISSVDGLTTALGEKQRSSPRLEALLDATMLSSAPNGQIPVYHGETIVEWRKVGSGAGDLVDNSALNEALAYVGRISGAEINDALDGSEVIAAQKAWSAAKIADELSDKVSQADIDGKADQAAVDAALALKADEADVNAALALKADSATVTAGLAGKENTLPTGTTAQYFRGDKSLATLDKTAVGLSNVDNTSDANKPVSTAQQTALDLKINSSAAGAYGLSLLGTANIAAAKALLALVKGDVGLGNVDNTSDANKPVSTAQQTALDAKVASATLAASGGSALVGFIDSGTGAIGLTLQALLRGVWTFAAAYGADAAASAAQNTAAINNAIAAVGAAGGGTVLLPRGTIMLADSNPGAASWDNNRAIYVNHDNVHLVGFGRGATVLKLENAADCHIIKFGQRDGGAVTVSNGSVENMTLDGNRGNLTAPTESDDHWHCIDVVSGCSKIRLANLHLTEAQYYGIGMQRDDISDCVIENVVIENTGADGIDWKNDTGTGTGNVIRNVSVSGFGLASASLANPQAGIDVRSGVYVENVTIFGMTGALDLHAVRVLGDGDQTSVNVPPQPSQLRGITVIGNNSAGSVGAYIAARNTRISDVSIVDCDDGIQLYRSDCRVERADVQGCVTAAMRLKQDPTIVTEADTTFISGLLARSNGAGIIYDSVDEVTVIGADIRSNTGIGHEIKAGCSNVRILGGTVSGNGTNISDSGTGTIIRDVAGAKTHNVATGSAAIDSTGSKTIIIAHGLAFTPAIADVQLTLERVSNVTDWRMGYLWVVTADATNVSVQLHVATASATVGATVTVKATIGTKNR